MGKVKADTVSDTNSAEDIAQTTNVHLDILKELHFVDDYESYYEKVTDEEHKTALIQNRVNQLITDIRRYIKLLENRGYSAELTETNRLVIESMASKFFRFAAQLCASFYVNSDRFSGNITFGLKTLLFEIGKDDAYYNDWQEIFGNFLSISVISEKDDNYIALETILSEVITIEKLGYHA